MKLSDYFKKENILNDGYFDDLSYSNASGKNIMSFCDTISYLKIALENDDISAIIIHKELVNEIKDTKKAIAFHENPRDKFFDIYIHMQKNNLFLDTNKYGIDTSANIASSAIISPKSYIGKNSIISENVIIKDNVFIGDDCFIDAGVILGNEGMLYKKDINNNNIFIKHAGIVKIDSNAIILSNAVIVKSVFRNMPTYIGEYSIIGIATTIGHEAHIDSNCRILGNCVVAKNANIGSHTIVGSNSMIKENITIGKNCDIKAGSVVVKNLKDNQVVSGNFALNHNQNVKNYFKSMK